MKKTRVLFASYAVKRRRAYLYRMLDGKKELNLFFGNNTTRDLKESFEERLASYVGTDYCVLTPSGMNAVELALNALKKEFERKELLMPAYTCKQLLPLTKKFFPVKLVDLNEKTFNSEKKNFSRQTSKKTGFWNVIHTWGNPVEMEQLMETADKKKVVVIEDCAHSLGSEINGKKTGSFGEVSIFSLRKNLPVMYGGAICTNNARIASNLFEKQKKFVGVKARDLLGLTALFFRKYFKKEVFPYMFHAKTAPNPNKTNYCQLSRLALCIAIESIKKLDFFIEQAEENAKFLKKNLSKNNFFQETHEKAKSNYSRLGIGFKNASNGMIFALKELQKNGFDTGLCYMQDFEENTKNSREKKIFYPHSLYVARTVLPLAIYNLELEDLKKIVEIISRHSL